jgi:membrane protease YdiL (CAAX protease family)
MDTARHMPRQAPLYGLVLALLPAVAVFGEFITGPYDSPAWHPLAMLAYTYLLAAVAFYCVRELRAALRTGGREGGDTPARAADLLACALFALSYFGLHEVLFYVGALTILRFELRVDFDLLYYALSLVLWLALFNVLLRVPARRYDFNLRLRLSWWDVPLLWGVGGATWLVLSFYLQSLGDIHPPMHIFGISRAASPEAYLAIGILFTVVNALTEELWFRGILLGALRGLLPPVAAILLQALLFGISHWVGTPRGILGFALAGVWGIALGWWTYSRRSLWPAFAVHLLADWLIFAYTNG